MRIIFALALVLTATSADAQYFGSNRGSPSPSLYGGFGTGSNPNSHYVSPSISSNGTYRPGHYQTNPNNTQLDNYGARGNVNPYTGAIGTRPPRY